MRITCVVILFMVAVIQSVQAQWTEIKLPRPGYLYSEIERGWAPLGPMEWVDSLRGFIFERNGVFYRTTDGGESWAMDSLETEGLTLATGWLHVGRCDFATTDYGVVSLTPYDDPHIDSVLYITTDGGDTWHREFLSPPGSWRNVGTRVVPLPNGNMLFFYGRFFRDSSRVTPALEEVMSRSTDLGDTWEVFSSDTLRVNIDQAQTRDWLYVDSLNTYRFTWSRIGDDYISYAKATTNGGKSWNILKYPYTLTHPLRDSKIAGRLHLNIKHVNDSGLVIVMGHAKSGAPGFGMVTTDVSRHSTSEGWLRVDADIRPFEEAIVDASYINGWHFYLTSRGKDQDSIWISHTTATNRKQGFPAPYLRAEYDEVSTLYMPTENKIFLWTKYGIWRFDRSIVSISASESVLKNSFYPKMFVYPNPATMDLQNNIYVEVPEQMQKRVNRICLINAQGVLLRDIALEESTSPDGSRRMAVPLSGINRGMHVVAILSNNTIVASKMVCIF